MFFFFFCRGGPTPLVEIWIDVMFVGESCIWRLYHIAYRGRWIPDVVVFLFVSAKMRRCGLLSVVAVLLR